MFWGIFRRDFALFKFFLDVLGLFRLDFALFKLFFRFFGGHF